MESIKQVIRTNRAYLCLDCGKCTSVCPISWRDPAFSPRTMVEATRLDGNILHNEQLWECLTCGRCTQVCPSDVRFLSFVREMRELARGVDVRGHCSHGSAVQTWMRLMANPELKQRRLDWLNDDEEIPSSAGTVAPPHLRELRTAERSETILFTGCLPYYQVLFGKIGAQGVEIAKSAVKVLNHLDIEPMVLPDEVCCGHDLLWEGETDTFRKLAEINTERLQATGAKRIVTTCPECAITLKRDYQLDMPVLHIAELLASGEFDLEMHRLDWDEPVTYQDPCRLGRHMGIYEEPRQVMEALGLELAEMENNRGRSICCGTSAWTHCGATAKSIQVDRLREAKATGAGTLVTTCAKCQIHFKCAQDDPRLEEEIAIEIKDLISLVAYAIR